jgi:aspartate 1-decarboxylase
VIRQLLKSKIHHATITEANVEYVGSITIDPELMDLADIVPYEKVLIADIDNGARLETYAIEGPRGSNLVCMNGAAALLVEKGHRVIIMSFASYDDVEAKTHRPRVVFVDDENRVLGSAEGRLS